MVRMLVGGSIKILVSLAIVAGAVALYRHQIKTSPRAGRQKPPMQAKLVQVIPVRPDNCATVVIGWGPVMPAQQVTLRPQVTGQIVEISPEAVPGGVVQAGRNLVTVDHRDYEIMVRQRQSDVARAVRDLKVEEGTQAIARQEYELLGELIADEDRELVLRQPQLASAQAVQESAQAALQKAQLDLDRCDIAAPFNAIVQDKHADLGATVSLNSNLVTLIGTDEAWIEVKVSVDELQWLEIPRTNGRSGSRVKIYNTLAWGPGRFRSARVIRLHGELENEGLLARLLVAIEDPFCLKPENRDQPRLLMGSFVRAEIEGRVLESVFPIKWSHLRDNNTTVWLLDGDSQLEVRPVQVAFIGPDEVFVSEGLTENEQLVVTDIAAPVPGMPLRIAGSQDELQQTADRMANDGGRR